MKVRDGALDEEGARHEEHGARVMTQHLEKGLPHFGLALVHYLERGAFGNPQADDQPGDDEDRAGQERQPPAP